MRRRKYQIIEDINNSMTKVQYEEFYVIPKLIKELKDSGYKFTNEELNEFYEYL